MMSRSAREPHRTRDPKSRRSEVQTSDDTGALGNGIHPYNFDQFSLPCEDLSEPEDGENSKILTQAPIKDREAAEIRANGARADEDAARLKKARESNSSRRKNNASTRKESKKSRTSETRHAPIMHEDVQSEDQAVTHDDSYDSSGINWGTWSRPPNGQWRREDQAVTHDDSYGSSGINWGTWSRLPNGQWRREGQDSSGSWYEEHRDEDPGLPRFLSPVSADQELIEGSQYAP